MSRSPQQGSKENDHQGAPWRIHLMELCRSGLLLLWPRPAATAKPKFCQLSSGELSQWRAADTWPSPATELQPSTVSIRRKYGSSETQQHSFEMCTMSPLSSDIKEARRGRVSMSGVHGWLAVAATLSA